MLLALTPETAGAYLSVHVTDFASLRDLLAWRRSARRDLAGRHGLTFAKALRQLTGRRSYGFGAGVPHRMRLLVLTAWTDPEAFEGFAESPVGRALADGAPYGWFAFGEIVATRGSHRGARPLVASGAPAPDGPLAVLTLGCASPRTLPRFLLHGQRLSGHILGAGGVVSAVSAGLPLTGNATFSLWSSTDRMLAFSYGARPDGHLATVKSQPPILVEQLNARIRPLRVEGRWDPRTTQNPTRLAELAAALA